MEARSLKLKTSAIVFCCIAIFICSQQNVYAVPLLKVRVYVLDGNKEVEISKVCVRVEVNQTSICKRINGQTTEVMDTGLYIFSNVHDEDKVIACAYFSNHKKSCSFNFNSPGPTIEEIVIGTPGHTIREQEIDSYPICLGNITEVQCYGKEILN